MPGWVTVPGNWHIAGHIPWVAEPQTVSDEAGISVPASRLCTGCFPWGMPEAGNRSVPVQRQVGLYQGASASARFRDCNMERSLPGNLSPFHSSSVSLCFLTAPMSTVPLSQLPAQSPVLPELRALYTAISPSLGQRLFPARSHDASNPSCSSSVPRLCLKAALGEPPELCTSVCCHISLGTVGSS